MLTNGYLIDVLGSGGHVVYPSNRCVVDLVDAHLLTLDLPSDTVTTCEAESVDGTEEDGHVRDLDPEDFAPDGSKQDQVRGFCLALVAEEVPLLTDAEADITCATIIERALAEGGEAAFDDDVLLSTLLEQVVSEQLAAD